MKVRFVSSENAAHGRAPLSRTPPDPPLDVRLLLPGCYLAHEFRTPTEWVRCAARILYAVQLGRASLARRSHA